MAARRYVPQPAPLCSPKNSLDPSKYSAVDAVLKDLKACTRRLQAALVSQQTELQILEKLVYKGNNQHRHALFWRRVSDVRRFSRRLQDMNVLDTVEALRHSFWDTGPQNTKTLKSAWTHLPDAKTVRNTVDRLHDYLTFANSMDLHLTKAYNHLVLDLKTGAFLQLILTLIAITSRMSMLLSEIGSALEQAWTSCYRLHIILDSSGSYVPRMVHGHFKTMHPEPPQQSTPALQTPIVIPDLDEDIGSSMPPTPGAQQTAIASGSGHSLDAVVPPSNEQDFMFTAPTPDTRAVARTVVSRKEIKVKSEKTLKRSVSVVEEEKDIGSKAKKKKQKKDEIDAIFGF